MASLQRRTVKGIDYWSLVESRRVNGKPRPIVIENFGNTKKFAEWLMNGRNENKILKSYSHGDTFALMKIAEQLEIESILDEVFKSRTRKGVKRSTCLILMALQSICNPGSKREFEEWLKGTTLPYDFNLTALECRRLWEQMDDISESELAEAEDKITQKIFQKYNFGLEKIALDYTNYFSYISTSNAKSELAKRGHNKQKRNDLKQYSLALITTKESGLPLCSHIYEGNKTDKTIFPEYLDILEARIPDFDPQKITLVFDGGGNTKENFEKLKTHFICSFSLAYCKELYDIDISEYKVLAVNGKKLKYYRLTHEVWGKSRECVLTYSNSLYEGQRRELESDISKAIEAIKKLNEQLLNPKSRISKTTESIQARVSAILNKKHISDIFRTHLDEDIEDTVIYVKCEPDEDKKDEIIHKYFGKKLTITDRSEWTTETILTTFREQDCIEKIFRSTKDNDHCAIRPQFHHTDQKIRVHIFCCLLGLTLATILHREACGTGLKVVAKFRLLDILKTIRRCWIADKNSTRISYVLEDLSDEQKEVWNAITTI
jgi:transposase